MAAKQPNHLPISPPQTTPPSSTFFWAMTVISLIAVLEMVAAGWKLFPELVDQFSNWWSFQRSTMTSSVIETSLPPSKEQNPALALRRAIMMETSGQTAKALTLLKSLQSLPNLPPSLQAEIQSHIQALSVMGSPKQTDITAAGLGARDDVGLQPGATLGIIECKLLEGKPAGRVLRVAMKARPGSSIDIQNIKIHVYFYEKTNDGDIVLTDAPIRSEWLNPPLDWTNGNPQILDVLYSGPRASPSPNSFYGYVVGIYYNGELQDTRAVPVRLVRDFPPPLFLSAPAKT